MRPGQLLVRIGDAGSARGFQTATGRKRRDRMYSGRPRWHFATLAGIEAHQRRRAIMPPLIDEIPLR